MVYILLIFISPTISTDIDTHKRSAGYMSMELNGSECLLVTYYELENTRCFIYVVSFNCHCCPNEIDIGFVILKFKKLGLKPPQSSFHNLLDELSFKLVLIHKI